MLTILLRISKLFSLSNIDDLIKNILNKGNIVNNGNDFNEKLVEELQRCQDYVNLLKQNGIVVWEHPTDVQNNKFKLKIKDSRTYGKIQIYGIKR